MCSNGPAMLIQHKKLKKQEKSKVCADRKCQATKYYKGIDKNYQTSVMQPEKPQINVQSKEPAKQSSFKKKQKELNMMTLKVNQRWNICDLTRTVKKILGQRCPEVIYGQWPRKQMCSYPNQQYHMSTEDCARIKSADLQDTTRVQWDQCIIMTKTLNLQMWSNLNLKELCYFHMWPAMKTFDMWSLPMNWLSMDCTQPEVTRNFIHKQALVHIYDL